MKKRDTELIQVPEKVEHLNPITIIDQVKSTGIENIKLNFDEKKNTIVISGEKDGKIVTYAANKTMGKALTQTIYPKIG